MVMRETDKHFLLAMFSATGIILFWKGIWEGPGSLPIIENAWVSLFIGAAMLTFSGIIFSEFDPLGGIEKGALKVMHSVHNHPKKREFSVRYYDDLRKNDVELKAEHMKHIEKNIVAFHHKGREIFIPIHRIRAVHRKGEVIWRR
ncbi:MAG TPA: RNA repair domain-containing protein [Candidatus Nanoarchaeia archaeon]|nr:RNA repair domain-containing protein [Candidatus Nanoarchaeia archaeon]